MTKALALTQPYTPNAIADGNGNLSGTVANLLTPNPKEVMFHSSAVGNAAVNIDLGAVKNVDTFFLGFINYPGGGGLTIQGGAGSYNSATLFPTGSLLAPSSSASPNPQHFYYKLDNPVAVRFIQFQISKGGVDGTIGVAAVGQSVQPFWGHEQGAGRPVYDTSVVERLFGGGFGINPGAIAGGYQWSFGDLSDAEVASLYAMAKSLGTSRSLVLAEDPEYSAGLNERVHWSLFERLDPYERNAPGASRYNMRVWDWA